MKRLSSTVTQKHLRTLAVRHGMQESNAGEKIESPLMKVDSSGNISCVICRTPLKSTSIWKVHVNSKAHKNNVQAAKELKTKILNTNSSRKSDKAEEVVQRNIALKNTKHNPVERKNNKLILVKEVDTAKNTQTTNVAPLDPLPLTFFDSASTDTKANNVESKDTEWELFQKEIKEVSEAPNEIFAGDQRELAVEKEIVEIDEQIQHWSKVLDLEEKRKNLNKKLIAKNKSIQKSNITGEESSEGEDFEEYTDWRSKVFK